MKEIINVNKTRELSLYQSIYQQYYLKAQLIYTP